MVQMYFHKRERNNSCFSLLFNVIFASCFVISLAEVKSFMIVRRDEGKKKSKKTNHDEGETVAYSPAEIVSVACLCGSRGAITTAASSCSSSFWPSFIVPEQVVTFHW